MEPKLEDNLIFFGKRKKALLVKKMEHDLDFLEFLGNKKTTSILRKTEDNLYLNKMSYNLNFLKDERGPKFAVKWKPTSISLQMEVYLNFCRIEDDLKVFLHGRKSLTLTR